MAAMSRILFAWEIGDHSGHVVPYLPLLRRYREAGHEVVVAARDTGEVGERVAAMFAGRRRHHR